MAAYLFLSSSFHDFYYHHRVSIFCGNGISMATWKMFIQQTYESVYILMIFYCVHSKDDFLFYFNCEDW